MDKCIYPFTSPAFPLVKTIGLASSAKNCSGIPAEGGYDLPLTTFLNYNSILYKSKAMMKETMQNEFRKVPCSIESRVELKINWQFADDIVKSL